MKHIFHRLIYGGAFLGELFLLSGCEKQSASLPSDKSPEQIALIKRGKAVYQAGCIACHNTNPRADGALGPAIAGSSKELLEARILRAEYPQGYQPKRPTKQMIPLPQYKDDLPGLFEYLQNP